MITVVIPLYNSRKSIEQCISSVLHQTKNDLIDEIIVVDDGSTDGSGDYVKEKFEGNRRIRVITKENGGVSSARNAGIKEAKSEWIALLDSDDVWNKKKIEKQWDQINRKSEIVFIGTNKNDEDIRWGKRIDERLYALDLRHILIKSWPHTSTALIKKTVFQEVGFFNERMKYAEDGDMWSRIAIKYPLYYIAESLEIAGGGKMQFGERGLSANLKGMHEGNIRNIRVMRGKGYISSSFFCFLYLYYQVKYLRRIYLSSINKKDLK